MKKILLICAVLFLISWAFMLFVLKTGDVAYIMLAVAGIIVLFLYSLRRVIT
jgi:hypothetical protein